MKSLGVDALVIDVLGTLVDEPAGITAGIHTFAPSLDEQTVLGLLALWHSSIDREQRRIVAGDRPYATSRVLDHEAACLVAERVGIDDPAAITRLAESAEHLPPWTDTVAGLAALAELFPLLGLSNASRSHLLELNFHAGLRWHQALSAEDARTYTGTSCVRARHRSIRGSTTATTHGRRPCLGPARSPEPGDANRLCRAPGRRSPQRHGSIRLPRRGSHRLGRPTRGISGLSTADGAATFACRHPPYRPVHQSRRIRRSVLASAGGSCASALPSCCGHTSAPTKTPSGSPITTTHPTTTQPPHDMSALIAHIPRRSTEQTTYADRPPRHPPPPSMRPTPRHTDRKEWVSTQHRHPIVGCSRPVELRSRPARPRHIRGDERGDGFAPRPTPEIRRSPDQSSRALMVASPCTTPLCTSVRAWRLGLDNATVERRKPDLRWN